MAAWAGSNFGGLGYALAPQDWIAPMIRNIGALLVRGFRPGELFAQFMGRPTRPREARTTAATSRTCRRGMSLRPARCLGDLIPVMTGVAMARSLPGAQNRRP